MQKNNQSAQISTTSAILDYLQTQGIQLNELKLRKAGFSRAQAIAHIQVAMATNHAIIQNAQNINALIEPEVIWHEQLTEYLPEPPENEPNQFELLKQLFMCLDSTYSRQSVQSATLYGVGKNEKLVKLVGFGQSLETVLNLDEETAWEYLAVRSARSGWLNLAENVEKWLQIGEIHGQHNQRSQSQISLPIYNGESGQVFGVLHLEANQPNYFQSQSLLNPSNSQQFQEFEKMADWIGLVLAVAPVLEKLLSGAVSH